MAPPKKTDFKRRAAFFNPLEAAIRERKGHSAVQYSIVQHNTVQCSAAHDHNEYKKVRRVVPFAMSTSF